MRFLVRMRDIKCPAVLHGPAELDRISLIEQRMMRCVGNLNNKIIVPADGSPGTDMITEIDEFFDLGVKDIGELAGFGIHLDTLRP